MTPRIQNVLVSLRVTVFYTHRKRENDAGDVTESATSLKCMWCKLQVFITSRIQNMLVYPFISIFYTQRKRDKILMTSQKVQRLEYVCGQNPRSLRPQEPNKC